MPEELEDEFGDIIKKARAGLGYTPDDIAHATSISVDDVVDMETYRLKPNPEQVRALASSLDLDADKLASIADGSWHPAEQQLNRFASVVLERIRVPYGAYSSNCYIVGCRETRHGAVVDPGGAAGQIVEGVKRLGLSLEWVLITHAHGDHAGALSAVTRAFPRAAVAVDPNEGLHGPEVRHPEDGETFPLGSLTIKAVSTPGHTRGSTCYVIVGEEGPHLCFVGDLLFAGSVGGAFWTSGAFAEELESIRSEVLSLPDDTILLPGHGPATTVGEEKEHNPFF